MKKIYQGLIVFGFGMLGLHSNAQTITVPFTTSGTFLVPTGVNSITIEVVGAGGDGEYNGGGGGGGGGYAIGTFSVLPGAILSVNIGIGGSGSAGGTTSVGSIIMATGGTNGSSGGVSVGGTGGTGIGGSTNRTGGNGGDGTWTYFGGGGGGAAGSTSNGAAGGNAIAWTGICLTPGGAAGLGGGLPGGDGGKGAGFTDAMCSSTDPAVNGLNYGAGGGGGNGIGSFVGEGANGYCVISYCNLDLSTTLTGVTITANATSPTSYQWINCSTGLPISGETSASFTASVNGSYAVIIEDGDCMDTSACVNITSVGLDPLTGLREMEVFPNPFTQKIQVLNSTGLEHMVMHNADGKLVWEGKNIAQQDFGHLPNGTYVLTVQGTVKSTYTLVKQ